MKTAIFGRSGLEVSRTAFGTRRLGGDRGELVIAAKGGLRQ